MVDDATDEDIEDAIYQAAQDSYEEKRMDKLREDLDYLVASQTMSKELAWRRIANIALSKISIHKYGGK